MDFKNFLIKDCGDSNFIKWDVVLFLGEYNPITKKEYERVKQFIDTVIKNPQWSTRFANRVDVGLISDTKHVEDRLELEANYQLTFDERNFITTKLFGLKMLKADFSHMGQISKIPSRKDEFIGHSKEVIDILKKNFHKANILIVLRPEDKNDERGFESIQPYLDDDQIKIGFIYFNETGYEESNYLNGISCDSDTLKIITLLNAYKPDPEELRGFASKYKIHHRINDIRKIHFKTNGDKYYLAFEQFFPDLKLNDDQEEESLKANYEVVLGMLKEMYLKFVH